MSQVLKRAEEALMALDTETLVSLYADEFLFEDTTSGERITTREALRDYFDRLFSLPGVAFSDASFFSCGAGRAAGQWTWSGKSLNSAQDYAIAGCSLFRLAGDLISEERIFYDPRRAFV